MGAGSRVARRRDRGRLGASVHALKPVPGTSQALEAGDARDASSSELPGVEEPVNPDEADPGAARELMVSWGVAHEHDVLGLELMLCQDELDLLALAKSWRETEAVVEP